ncbi:MAG: 3'(2'),5'-bisphosphate nucleotidase [Gammaproteobacteria bacterium 28-57-27]|nr:MAG: 3'(2'),5'-bisphosphate nucleotidase [Gammaproteobacteria bacterium 28-57-27]
MFTHPLLDDVVTLAVKAGEAVMAVYARDFSIEEKADSSPLTEADQAAHAIIVAGLKELTPGIPILSEEETDLPGCETWGTSAYWLVDPLDGTKEFIKRNGEFTVNIALIDAGVAVLGVVYAPVLAWMYAASSMDGAHKKDENGVWMPLRCAEHAEGTPWRVVGSRSHSGDSLGVFLQKLGAYEMLPMGSSLKLCLVAEGKADIYPRLGPTSLWDTAAAQCVVEATGGKVVTLDGQALSYANTGEFLNPFFIAHGRSAVSWPVYFE